MDSCLFDVPYGGEVPFSRLVAGEIGGIRSNALIGSDFVNIIFSYRAVGIQVELIGWSFGRHVIAIPLGGRSRLFPI